MSYSDRTIKIVFGRSFNECNHPDCSQIIVELDPNTGRPVVHGEIAHIRARKKGGERWDADYKNVDDEPNLILLCHRHHNTVDQKGAGEYYTVEMLEQWKAAHCQAKELDADREWVYGPSALVFAVNGVQHKLEYWHDKSGQPRFYTPEQLAQAHAAKDLAILFSQLSSLIANIDNSKGEPADPSHQTMNDGYIRMFKEDVKNLKRGWSSKTSPYESGMHRLYRNLQACPDITLKELSLVGSEEKMRPQTVIVGGELTPQRLQGAMKDRPNKPDT